MRHLRQDVRAPGRQVDPGDAGSGERGHRRSGHHRDQGGRDPSRPAADPARNPGPQDQDGDGQRADERGGRSQPAQLVGQGERVGDGGTLRGAAKNDVQLGERDGHADSGESAVDDGGADGEGTARRPQRAQQDLKEPGPDGDRAGGAPAVDLDQLGCDHGQPGGRATDLERGAAEQSGDDAADRGGDEAGLQRGVHGDGEAKRHGDGEQEDCDRRGHIGARDAESSTARWRRAVWSFDSRSAWWARATGCAVVASGDASRHVPVSSGAARSRIVGTRPWVTACSGGISQLSVNRS